MTVLNLACSVDSDDAVEWTGVYNDHTAANYGFFTTNQMVAWIFRSVSGLAPGATINSATLRVYLNPSSPVTLRFDAQLASNPATFNSSANEISSRTFTTTKKDLSTGGSGFALYSFNVKELIEEILANAITPSAILMRVSYISAGCLIIMREAALGDALLDIDYSVPTPHKPRKTTVQLKFS